MFASSLVERIIVLVRSASNVAVPVCVNVARLVWFNELLDSISVPKVIPKARARFFALFKCVEADEPLGDVDALRRMADAVGIIGF